jgi:hypothetical protein
MTWATLTSDALAAGDEINDGIAATALPSGPTTISISFGSADPEPGDICTASWTNISGSTGLIREVEWQRWISGSGWATHTFTQHASPASGANLVTTGYNSGDGIRCRVRYIVPADELVGDGVTAGDRLIAGSELNTGLLFSASLSPTDGLFSKAEIIAATPTTGTYGNFSNEIFFP